LSLLFSYRITFLSSSPSSWRENKLQKFQCWDKFLFSLRILCAMERFEDKFQIIVDEKTIDGWIPGCSELFSFLFVRRICPQVPTSRIIVLSTAFAMKNLSSTFYLDLPLVWLTCLFNIYIFNSFLSLLPRGFSLQFYNLELFPPYLSSCIKEKLTMERFTAHLLDTAYDWTFIR